MSERLLPRLSGVYEMHSAGATVMSMLRALGGAQPKDTTMRKLAFLPILSALALTGAACQDESPRLNASDTAKSDTAKSEIKPMPADKQALRVQRDAKLDNPEKAKVDEKAQYDAQKNDSLAVPNSAAQIPPADAKPMSAGAEARSITGQVASASDSQVELKSGNDLALKLAVDDQTAVRIDGQQGKASQIIAGSDVRASYKTVDGKMTALRLDVTNNKAK